MRLHRARHKLRRDPLASLQSTRRRRRGASPRPRPAARCRGPASRRAGRAASSGSCAARPASSSSKIRPETAPADISEMFSGSSRPPASSRPASRYSVKRAIAFQCSWRASAPAAATSTTAVRASAGSTAKRSTIVARPVGHPLQPGLRRRRSWRRPRRRPARPASRRRRGSSRACPRSACRRWCGRCPPPRSRRRPRSPCSPCAPTTRIIAARIRSTPRFGSCHRPAPRRLNYSGTFIIAASCTKVFI